MQKIFRRAFRDSSTNLFRYTNDFFALLTLISILGIVLETVEGLYVYTSFFLVLEYVTVFFFVCEYFARMIAADKPFKYIFSFFGIVDLIAVVPTFLGFANFTFLKSARILRIMRFLRMMRLAKLMRPQKKNAHIDLEDLHDEIFHLSLQIYAMALFSAVLISASLMWFVEGYRDIFVNIPLTMLWSAKVLLGGASQAQPETIGGDVIVIVTRFTGLVLFGLLINIVGGSVKKLLLGSSKE